MNLINLPTVKTLKIRRLEVITVMVLKFVNWCFSTQQWFQKMQIMTV